MKKVVAHIGRFKHAFIIALLVSLAVWDKSMMKTKKSRIVTHKKEAAFPYRTINSMDTSQGLIAYEFHRAEDNRSGYAECAVIIKTIDPAKDNYKMYVKSVLNDIVRTLGRDKMEVIVFDDQEAYNLSEVKGGREFGMLTQSESDTVVRHIVAIYHSYLDGDFEDNNTLYYYAQAGNKYTEQEVFQPGK